jgi:hypothetical protein
MTAFDYALETGNTELIELLRFEWLRKVVKDFNYSTDSLKHLDNIFW